MENLSCITVDLLKAGTQTTSDTLRQALLLMIKYPKVQSKWTWKHLFCDFAIEIYINRLNIFHNVNLSNHNIWSVVVNIATVCSCMIVVILHRESSRWDRLHNWEVSAAMFGRPSQYALHKRSYSWNSESEQHLTSDCSPSDKSRLCAGWILHS